MNFKDTIYLCSLLCIIHHTISRCLFIELSDCGTRTSLLPFASFISLFFTNFVPRRECVVLGCFSVYSALYLSFRYLANSNSTAVIGYHLSIWPPAHKTNYDTMPPRRRTPWVSHGSLLSDRIRPPSGSPQPTKSEKGKGKVKAATPEPPPRSATVRKLDELLDGLRSLSTSNQHPKNETRKVTVHAGVSADREGCFCQGTSATSFFKFLCLSFGPLFRFFPNPLFISHSNIHYNPL